MKIGQLVMLIGTDGFMPPIGAVGEIVAPFDGEDYSVMFPGHPCPVESEEWYVPPHMLMSLNPGDHEAEVLGAEDLKVPA